MTRFALFALFIAAPFTAAAQATCTFTTECLEGEACGETSYAATLANAEAEVVQLITDAETLEGRMIASDDIIHYVFEAPSAAHLLSTYADGAARYSIHMAGPFTITYHGTCEGTP